MAYFFYQQQLCGANVQQKSQHPSKDQGLCNNDVTTKPKSNGVFQRMIKISNVK